MYARHSLYNECEAQSRNGGLVHLTVASVYLELGGFRRCLEVRIEIIGDDGAVKRQWVLCLLAEWHESLSDEKEEKSEKVFVEMFELFFRKLIKDWTLVTWKKSF